jgi:hypothetical protein
MFEIKIKHFLVTQGKNKLHQAIQRVNKYWNNDKTHVSKFRFIGTLIKEFFHLRKQEILCHMHFKFQASCAKSYQH